MILEFIKLKIRKIKINQNLPIQASKSHDRAKIWRGLRRSGRIVGYTDFKL